MSDANNSSNTDSDQSSQRPHITVQGSDESSSISASAPVQTPPQSHNPPHHNSGMVSGPRLNPHHGDRPNSAPLHLERLSGMILRRLGDQYDGSSYGRSLRIIGDQMTFEQEIRRALSYSDLDRLRDNADR